MRKGVTHKRRQRRCESMSGALPRSSAGGRTKADSDWIKGIVVNLSHASPAVATTLLAASVGYSQTPKPPHDPELETRLPAQEVTDDSARISRAQRALAEKIRAEEFQLRIKLILLDTKARVIFDRIPYAIAIVP